MQVDIRLLAATHKDLPPNGQRGEFREDLFFRLPRSIARVPPLRERPEDIRWLTERMLQQLAAEQGRPVAMSEAFLRDVMGRNWKGNARELRSYLEEAVVLSEAGILDVTDHSPNSRAASPRYPTCLHRAFIPLQAMVEDAERLHIRRALERTQGSVGKTADLLGISRKTLWEKMRKLRIANDVANETNASPLPRAASRRDSRSVDPNSTLRASI